VAAGFAPIEYIQALRVTKAKQMRETDQFSIDVVCASIAGDDPASFRRKFERGIRLSPAAYHKKSQRTSLSAFGTAAGIWCIRHEAWFVRMSIQGAAPVCSGITRVSGPYGNNSL
jgi:hypothetical protein